VRLEGLSPGVQDGEQADPSAEMPGIGCDFQQRGRAGFEQQSKEPPLVLPHRRHERVRHAEDQVIVAHRQQFLLPLGEPLVAGVGLALGAVRLRGAILDGSAGLTYATLQSFYEYLILIKTKEFQRS